MSSRECLPLGRRYLGQSKGDQKYSMGLDATNVGSRMDGPPPVIDQFQCGTRSKRADNSLSIERRIIHDGKVQVLEFLVLLLDMVATTLPCTST